MQELVLITLMLKEPLEPGPMSINLLSQALMMTIFMQVLGFLLIQESGLI